jgi:putative DNA-invertase from lambdoid prophage Rac
LSATPNPAIQRSSPVSTTDQTTARQVTQARAAGFKIDEVVSDEGRVRIATKLCDREQGKWLFDIFAQV